MAKKFLTLLVAGLLCAGALAQNYPSRPVRFIVPFAAGGGTDLIARRLAQKLSLALGQPVIVDNRPGASGVIGTDLTAKAAPDGYTLMIATPTFTVNPSMMAKLPYDVAQDFAPVALIATSPHLLAVNPTLPVKTIPELVAYAKSHKEPLTYSSGSTGGSSHLAGELFNSVAGIRLVHIPYKGTGEAARAVVSGTVQLAFLDVQTMLPLVNAGLLRAIAVTGAARSTVVPALPTIAESGYPGFESGVWYGVLAPARTPPAVITRLNAEIVRIMQNPEMLNTLSHLGAEPAANSPAAFAQLIQAELPRWSKVIRESGLQQAN